jgi:hypothetical protein
VDPGEAAPRGADDEVAVVEDGWGSAAVRGVDVAEVSERPPVVAAAPDVVPTVSGDGRVLAGDTVPVAVSAARVGPVAVEAAGEPAVPRAGSPAADEPAPRAGSPDAALAPDTDCRVAALAALDAAFPFADDALEAPSECDACTACGCPCAEEPVALVSKPGSTVARGEVAVVVAACVTEVAFGPTRVPADEAVPPVAVVVPG